MLTIFFNGVCPCVQCYYYATLLSLTITPFFMFLHRIVFITLLEGVVLKVKLDVIIDRVAGSYMVDEDAPLYGGSDASPQQNGVFSESGGALLSDWVVLVVEETTKSRLFDVVVLSPNTQPASSPIPSLTPWTTQ